uniref:Uncharacterized protein n=1 Tax=Cacopsylla melanoneura TaxID=428564 RepID=A0A8D9EXN8_9HEMI
MLPKMLCWIKLLCVGSNYFSTSAQYLWDWSWAGPLVQRCPNRSSCEFPDKKDPRNTVSLSSNEYLSLGSVVASSSLEEMTTPDVKPIKPTPCLGSVVPIFSRSMFTQLFYLKGF